ncbi:hypothetical protein P4S68_05220 [Pseudoalteromonas sp. Hal099]
MRGELMDMSYQNDAPGQENDWQDKSSRIWLPGLSGFTNYRPMQGYFWCTPRVCALEPI